MKFHCITTSNTDKCSFKASWINKFICILYLCMTMLENIAACAMTTFIGGEHLSRS